MPRHDRGGSLGRAAAEQAVQGAGSERLRSSAARSRPPVPRSTRSTPTRSWSPPARPRSPRSRSSATRSRRSPPVTRRARGAFDFPPADSGYHNYAEMTAEINQIVADHPDDRPQVQLRHLLRGPRPDRRQDQRQRRHRRGRARGAVHPPPARPRAPDRRDGALPAATCSPTATAPTRRITNLVNSREIWIMPGPQPGRRRVRHRHRLLPLLAQEPPAQRRLVRRRHRPEPQLGLQVGLLRRLLRLHLQRDLPGRGRRVGARRSAAVRRLRAQPGRRRRAADQGAHRLPHLRRADPVAVRLHLQRHRPRHDPGRPATRSPPSARRWPPPTATPPSRPATSTSPTARSTTGCGAPTRSSATPSRCTRPARLARLLPAGRADRPADHPQPGGRAALPGVLRLRLPDHRQGVAVLRHRHPAGDGLLRHLRDGDRLDRPTPAAPTPPPPASGSAATPRPPPPAAPSSSAPPSAAPTTWSPAGWRARPPATTTSTAASPPSVARRSPCRRRAR